MVQKEIDQNIRESLSASNFGAQLIPIRAPLHLHLSISLHEEERKSLEELPGCDPLILERVGGRIVKY